MTAASFPPGNRRRFLSTAAGGIAAAVAAKLGVRWLAADEPAAAGFFAQWDFTEVGVSTADDLIVPPGFAWEILLRTDEPIHPGGAKFGAGSDFFAVIPDGPDTGWLWVNHEAPDMPELEDGTLHDKGRGAEETVLRRVGGSCLRVRRTPEGRWRPDTSDARNFRVDGLTENIRLTGPAAGSAEIGGVQTVIGSLANCGGAVSPWGTFFSGEENYYHFFGDPDTGEKGGIKTAGLVRPSEHYGWMLEVDPRTGECFKHTALGRFAHENIAFATARDGRLVAYMGDDRARQCLYKYVSHGKFDAAAGVKNRALLADGTLYAADTTAGKWRALVPSEPRLLAEGMDAARICVRARKAAALAGATPLARPEYVQVHPESGAVFTTLTSWVPPENQPTAKGPAGAILVLREKDGDHGADEFSSEILPTVASGLSWPDNITLVNDRLLVTSDYKVSAAPESGSAQEKFGNNSLYVAAIAGPDRGKARRFCAGPLGSELCSPMISPDGSELWLSVQHPGEGGAGTWPGNKPCSALVAIRRKA